MSKYAQQAAIAGKNPRVGVGTDMGDVDAALYSTDPAMSAGMWTCTPKPVPPPPPLSPKEWQRLQDDRADALDRRRGTSARAIATGLTVLGSVGRFR